MTGWAILLAVLLGLVLTLGVVIVLLEQPSRLERFGGVRRWSVVGLGISMVAVLGTVVGQGEPGQIAAPSSTPSKPASLATVLREVRASSQISTVPTDLIPPFSQLLADPESYLTPESTGCHPTSTSPCLFGDRAGTHTMVLYGDSHAGMWTQALNDIANRAHWRLDVYVMASCPAALLATEAPGTRGDWVACDQWHHFAIRRINQIDPDLLIVSQTAPYATPAGTYYTPSESEEGLEQFFSQVKALRKLVLGNLPGSGGPDCLARHPDNVQACSGPPVPSLVPYAKAEMLAAAASGVRYLNVTPWFCAQVCSSIIGRHEIYAAGNHVTEAYSVFLEGVLARALELEPTAS
jgi:hypothetical protein